MTNIVKILASCTEQAFKQKILQCTGRWTFVFNDVEVFSFTNI